MQYRQRVFRHVAAKHIQYWRNGIEWRQYFEKEEKEIQQKRVFLDEIITVQKEIDSWRTVASQWNVFRSFYKEFWKTAKQIVNWWQWLQYSSPCALLKPGWSCAYGADEGKAASTESNLGRGQDAAAQIFQGLPLFFRNVRKLKNFGRRWADLKYIIWSPQILL